MLPSSTSVWTLPSPLCNSICPPPTLTHDAKGHARLLKLLSAHPGAHVICEATGDYEQAVVRVLHGVQSPVSVIEAGRVRHDTKAKGLRAKTDPIDATVLSEYGRTFQPAATPAPTAQKSRQAALATRLRKDLATAANPFLFIANMSQCYC